MPSSTTLETLVLEINSSAVKANEGIGRTVGSLRSLARAVGTVWPGLREMNRELLKTSRLKILCTFTKLTLAWHRKKAALAPTVNLLT